MCLATFRSAGLDPRLRGDDKGEVGMQGRKGYIRIYTFCCSVHVLLTAQKYQNAPAQ